MTVKQLLKYTLIELGKVNAPTMKLYEFNYYVNKAINEFTNKVYNNYDVNQQTTDDIRALQGTAYLTPQPIKLKDRPLVGSNDAAGNYLSQAYPQISSLYGAAYEAFLPMDYLHLLNCVCTFQVTKPYDCYDADTYIHVGAKRMTADAWPLVVDDIYNRPSPQNPYFLIYNQNRTIVDKLPTDPVTEIADAKAGEATTSGTDINGVYGVTSYDDDKLAKGEERGSNLKRTFTFANGHKESLVEKTAAQRIGNPSNVRIEIRYGRDDSVFKLREIQVDYLKVPQFIRLTQEQLDLTQDTSQILEWPNYVCQEIVNSVKSMFLERMGSPRLANSIQMDQSIARPQQQAAPAAQQQG